MERSGGEHCVERADREGYVLESPEVKADRVHVADPPPGERDHVLAGIDGVHHEPPLGERLRQLARAAADLQHPTPGVERADGAGRVDELVWISGPNAVVRFGDGIEDLADARFRCARGHAPSIGKQAQSASQQTSPYA